MTARLSLLLLAAVACIGGFTMAGVYYAAEGWRMAALLLVTGGPVLVVAHLCARMRGRIGSLSRQLLLSIVVGFMAAVLVIGVVAADMFVSPHDAFVLLLTLGFGSALAIYCARALTRGAVQDIETVRDGIRAVGEGERALRIETRAQDEIAELAESANRMIERLGEQEARRSAADAARRDLIAAVSHDLRTPLASLRVLAEAIESDVVDAETRNRYVGQLSVHIHALGDLIDDLFELSRLEAGEIQWTMQEVRLDELLEETVEAMRAQAGEHSVRTLASVPADLPSARANPEKLQRVLFNLIQNAIRHTPPDGTVTVAAASNGDSVEIEVADTGEGVAPAEREQVFEAFYRGGRESPRTRAGSGLGLTICRAIVEAHEGEIWLDESNVGTRVRFTLPRAVASVAAGGSPGTPG